MATAAQCPVHPEFDPLSAEFLVDPYAVMAALPLADEPVFYAPSLDYYVVSRFADVESVLLDHESYSAATAQLPLVQLVPEALNIPAEGGYRPQPSMVSLDQPAHTRLRRPAARGVHAAARRGDGAAHPRDDRRADGRGRPERAVRPGRGAHVPAPRDDRVLVHGRAGDRLAAAALSTRPCRCGGG